MKNVLIITYLFPPTGGPGVQRTLKFTKYLSAHGYEPIILTPNPKLIRYIKDYSLFKEINPKLKIYRTFILDINWIFKILYGLKLNSLVKYISETIMFPDFQSQWIPFAKRAIKKIIRNENIEVVFSTSPPHSTHILAHWIKKRYNIPVVMDFRDPFTFNTLVSRKNQKKKFKLEQSFHDTSDFTIVTTPEVKELCKEKFNLPDNKIQVITNGYDKSNFKSEPVRKEKNGDIILSHIGRLYADYNAIPLLLSLSKIKKKLENLKIQFVGNITIYDKEIINKHNLNSLIKVIDYVPHEQAQKFQKESDYLLLLQPDEKFTLYIPGKTFEYISSNKKIIAIVPTNGSCSRIIKSTKTGIVLSPYNLDEIAQTLIDIDNRADKINYNPDWKELQKYDRKYLTKQLSTVFNTVIQNHKKQI